MILEVFPECFLSHMNPSVTSSVTFHIQGSCFKNGKTGKFHASEIMASEMCEWLVLLYKICTVFTIEKCEFRLKTFFFFNYPRPETFLLSQGPVLHLLQDFPWQNYVKTNISAFYAWPHGAGL